MDLWKAGRGACSGRRVSGVLLRSICPQYLDGKNLRVPDWAWLNVLAHGSQDDIGALAVGEPAWRISSDTSVWHDALSFLAQELVSQATRRGRAVTELQRSALVPLELELAGRRGPSMGPTAFVGHVRSAIAQHPSSRRR